jgi:hypothetical protein
MTLRKAKPRTLEESPCAEWERLFSRFISAIGDVLAVQTDNTGEDLLRLAEARRKSAKNALFLHLEAHPNCGARSPDSGAFPAGYPPAI